MCNALRKPPPRMAVAEFIAWPGLGMGWRSQLVDGEVCTIRPGSVARGLVHTALIGLVENHLKAVGSAYYALCRPPVIPRVRASLNLRTPALAVTATPLQPSRQYDTPAPFLLIEILTSDNAADVWKNIWAYCTIPSVREIAVVHSTRVKAEVLRRGGDGHWPEEPEEINPGGRLLFESIDLDCPLSEVYTDTHLGQGDTT